MSDEYAFDRCSTCGEWGFVRSHRCPPRWEVYCPSQGDEPDDARDIFGSSAEEAVEKWAERHDSGGDYTIVGGSEETVMVRKADSEDPWVAFVVTGETVPEYHAHRKEEPR